MKLDRVRERCASAGEEKEEEDQREEEAGSPRWPPPAL